LTWRDPGSPGQSPAQGPHRPARAEFPHAVLQAVDSLFAETFKRLSSIPYIAIHRCFVSTALGSIAPSVFPTDGPTARCPPSLHWVPSGQVPLLHRYYEDTTTSRRPSRLASFPSLGNTIYIACVHAVLCACTPRDALAHGWGICIPAALTGTEGMETARSPKFLGDPPSHLPYSLTPAGPPRQVTTALRCCPCYVNGKDSRALAPIEAESHGFCDRCLRFTTRVTPDHARLASGC